MLRTLADGRLADLAGPLDELRAADPLLAELAEADAAARVAAIGLADLRDLEQRVGREAPERPWLRWWALALLGERAFLDTDLGVIPAALQVLEELPEEPFASLPLLYVRGRLRRIASAVYLVAPSPDSMAGHFRLRDQALADFRRGGLTAEVAVTRGLSAAIHAISTWDDVVENLEVVRDARAQLHDADDSVWLPVLDQLHALVALTAGDLDAADAAIAAVERRRDLHPVFAAFADVARAEHALVVHAGGQDAVKAAIAALDRLRASHPQLLGLTQLRIANVLADVGCTDEARSVGLAGMGWPPTNTAMARAASVLRVRLDVLDGVALGATELLPLLTELEGLGHRRRAGAMALRSARDFDRVGATAEASTLRRWAQDRLPDVRRRTAWELLWSQPLVATAAGPTAPARIAVRVMVPVLGVEVDGVPVRLRTMPAKLLLALLVEHPEPLHVERAVDLLWPDASADVGRPRLNTVVHRLRTALALRSETLRRVGDVLLLAPDGWDVDLFRFRAGLRGPPDEQLAAVEAVAGNLCHVQFPYDELFVERRHAIAAEIASIRPG